MGTTMSFYLIENRGLDVNILTEGMKAFRKKYGLNDQEEKLSSYIGRLAQLPPAFLSKFGVSQEEVEQISERLRREEEKTDGLGKVIPFPGTIPPEEQEMPREKGPVLAWRANARWLPFFEENLCDGYNASSRDAERLAKAFGAPVLAFSIFDSDILFLSYADPERRLGLDFAKADFEEAEEMIDSPFQMEFPQFLCAWGDEQALREIWEGEEVFADDRMAKLCGVIGAEVLYDGQDLPEGYERIE